MYFKVNSKNPYKNLVKNLKKITTCNKSDYEKVNLYRSLYVFLDKSLNNTSEQYLNNYTTYNYPQWNELMDNKVKYTVTNINNPWLRLKNEFEEHLQDNPKDLVNSVSKSLSWFYNTPYLEDWITN
jgi:hypothetical protein